MDEIPVVSTSYPSHSTTTLNGVPLTPATAPAHAGDRNGQPFGRQRQGLRKRIGSALAGLAALLAKFGAVAEGAVRGVAQR